MLVWISIGVLAIMNIIITSVLIQIIRRNRTHDIEQEPSVYLTLVDKKYDQYLTEVVQHLNHEYAIPLMRDEIADSRLVDYIVNSFVTNIPIERCASNIVHIVDELVEQAESVEAE